jgi:hypothetical protein
MHNQQGSVSGGWNRRLGIAGVGNPVASFVLHFLGTASGLYRHTFAARARSRTAPWPDQHRRKVTHTDIYSVGEEGLTETCEPGVVCIGAAVSFATELGASGVQPHRSGRSSYDFCGGWMEGLGCNPDENAARRRHTGDEVKRLRCPIPLSQAQGQIPDEPAQSRLCEAGGMELQYVYIAIRLRSCDMRQAMEAGS